VQVSGAREGGQGHGRLPQLHIKVGVCVSVFGGGGLGGGSKNVARGRGQREDGKGVLSILCLSFKAMVGGCSFTSRCGGGG
jgi:hypothetical protein